jgi:enterochelin esterase family protein
MDYPGTFGAVACHSGDMGFDWLYRHDLIVLANGLRKYGADPLKFIDYCLAAPKLTGFETHLLMILGMAASYSPNPASPTGFDLPLDLKTGLMNEDVWATWLSHDPVHRIAQGAEGLAKLGTLFVDCGLRDQYNLQYGARQFAAKLQSKGIKHVYEEFDDDHSGLQYRFDRSLPILLEGLQT